MRVESSVNTFSPGSTVMRFPARCEAQPVATIVAVANTANDNVLYFLISIID